MVLESVQTKTTRKGCLKQEGQRGRRLPPFFFYPAKTALQAFSTAQGISRHRAISKSHLKANLEGYGRIWEQCQSKIGAMSEQGSHSSLKVWVLTLIPAWPIPSGDGTKTKMDKI